MTDKTILNFDTPVMTYPSLWKIVEQHWPIIEQTLEKERKEHEAFMETVYPPVRKRMEAAPKHEIEQSYRSRIFEMFKHEYYAGLRFLFDMIEIEIGEAHIISYHNSRTLEPKEFKKTGILFLASIITNITVNRLELQFKNGWEMEGGFHQPIPPENILDVIKYKGSLDGYDEGLW